MQRARKAVGGDDKSASHATRIAGTENFKPKFAPDFPRVTIVETHPSRVMTPEQLEALGLLASPERIPAVPLKYTSLAGAPPNKDGSDRAAVMLTSGFLTLPFNADGSPKVWKRTYWR